MIGVELGGALKNVIAIAAGIVDGLGYGHNTVAALITRGLAEISAARRRPGRAAGHPARAWPASATSVLTCTGDLSRNRRVGQALGAGHSVGEALAELHMVAEGVRTTQAACALAERAGGRDAHRAADAGGALRGQTSPRGGGGVDVEEPEKGVNSVPAAAAGAPALNSRCTA